MSNEMKVLFKQFNTVYFNFLTFLKVNSNGDKAFNTFYNRNHIMKSTNIKYFIKYWNENISKKYYDSIQSGDIEFFLNKDYDEDSKNTSPDIMSYIDYFKSNYDTFEKGIIIDFTNYIKILTKISHQYYN